MVAPAGRLKERLLLRLTMTSRLRGSMKGGTIQSPSRSPVHNQIMSQGTFFRDSSSYVSYSISIDWLYLPVLTREVKTASSGLNVAGQRNLYKMTLTVGGATELFYTLYHAEEFHHWILAFSNCHNRETSRVYGRYPIVEATIVVYWHHSICRIIVTDCKGTESGCGTRSSEKCMTCGC